MEAPFTADFFRRLQQLKIKTRKTFLGTKQGIHRSSKKGQGLEFADYRLYTPGDDFRHIDWQVYGRTDRMYVRQFREEQDLEVNVLIDSSASMSFPENQSKFELASNIALALGFVALTDNDSVRFSVLGQDVSPKYSGPQSASRAFRYLKKFGPRDGSSERSYDFPSNIRAAVARQKSPGKCYVLSDFMFELDEFIAGLDVLKARNFDISVVQVLSPGELILEENNESLAIDSETGDEFRLIVDNETRKKYQRLLKEHISSLETYCKKNAMGFVGCSSAEELSELVLGTFPKKGFLT